MRFLLLFTIFPSIVLADQGVEISCVNMKNLLDEDYKVHKFKFDVMTFQYFDEKKNQFLEIANKDLIIKKDFFAARLPEYELGFQINKSNESKNPIMSMSKYDYKNNEFIDHYLCDVKTAYIESN